jgi:hypothetical protein
MISQAVAATDIDGMSLAEYTTATWASIRFAMVTDMIASLTHCCH